VNLIALSTAWDKACLGLQETVAELERPLSAAGDIFDGREDGGGGGQSVCIDGAGGGGNGGVNGKGGGGGQGGPDGEGIIENSSVI